MSRRFRDRDYLQTPERYFFCVVGPIHPRDRVIAYLKYVPDPHGKWGRGRTKFRRTMGNYTIPNLLETLKSLEQHPEFLYHSSTMGIEMSAVPLRKISSHLKPEKRIHELVKIDRPDALQRKALDLINLVSDESGVSLGYFGVTGSLLLNIHREFSDIDVVVYGTQNSQAVKESLLRVYKEMKSPLQRFDKDKMENWCIKKAEMYPLTYEEAMRILMKKWGRGLYRKTMFSVHPTKLDDEVSERYGDRVFRLERIVEIEATVSDADEADFLPAIYKIEDVKVRQGPEDVDIREIASYEGLYGGIAEKGEKLLAYGKLERVISRRTDEEYHRVLIGSKEAQGKDYIKPK